MVEQASLFSPVKMTDTTGWIPDEPPSLDGITDIELDTEGTGLKWWAGDRPIGVAIRTPDGRCRYLAWGHRGGGHQLSEDAVKRWFKHEVRGKNVTGLNIKFDDHNLNAWGISLEDQGCHLSDIGHRAALLDDHRMHLSLEAISQDYLGVGKITTINGSHLDPTKMADYPAGMIAEYAKQDVRLVGENKAKMQPLIDQQELGRVLKLEDDVIFPVCEMERNAAKLDTQLLKRWAEESEQKYLRSIWQIYRDVGIKVEPNKVEDIAKLFRHHGLPIDHYTAGNKPRPSFTDEVLKSYTHPHVRLIREARKLSNLRSKYLVKYLKTCGDGFLRYSLHQLRAGEDGDVAGTISGRFSSTALNRRDGANIQQVQTAEKQRLFWGYEDDDVSHDDEIFIVRKLFVPERGLFLSADAAQIEFRLFAHYANSPHLLAAYAQDPRVSFHLVVWDIVKMFVTDMSYKNLKNLNFAKLYGAGVKKVAIMLGVDEDTAARFVEIYDRNFPDVRRLLMQASTLAEARGYVKTLLGRRIRFVKGCGCPACIYGPRYHKALNGVIQGGAADVMKTKLVELHQRRKEVGMTVRFTVHDEVCGDVPDAEAARKVESILNFPSFPELRVPILWEVKTGSNWAEAA